MDLNEPVWREDIEKEVEYLGEGSRTLSVFYHRLSGQGAPPDLLNELAAAYHQLIEARRRLEGIRDCFQEEPVRS